MGHICWLRLLSSNCLSHSSSSSLDSICIYFNIYVYKYNIGDGDMANLWLFGKSSTRLSFLYSTISHPWKLNNRARSTSILLIWFCDIWKANTNYVIRHIYFLKKLLSTNVGVVSNTQRYTNRFSLIASQTWYTFVYCRWQCVLYTSSTGMNKWPFKMEQTQTNNWIRVSSQLKKKWAHV